MELRIQSQPILSQPILLMGAIAVCLGGALWAIGTSGHCGGCAEASESTGRAPLAVIGAAYYALLLCAALLPASRPTAGQGLLVAAGVHAVLLARLVTGGVLCGACFLTAAGAFAGAGLALLDPGNRRLAALLVPLAASFTSVGMRSLESNGLSRLPAPAHLAALAVLEEEFRVRAGSARMVVYTRSGCTHCERLRAEFLPALAREYGSRLRVEEREAWSNLPTPTLVVQGARNTYYPGLPPLTDLRQAVRRACGGPNPGPPPRLGFTITAPRKTLSL